MDHFGQAIREDCLSRALAPAFPTSESLEPQSYASPTLEQEAIVVGRELEAADAFLVALADGQLGPRRDVLELFCDFSSPLHVRLVDRLQATILFDLQILDYSRLVESYGVARALPGSQGGETASSFAAFRDLIRIVLQDGLDSALEPHVADDFIDHMSALDCVAFLLKSSPEFGAASTINANIRGYGQMAWPVSLPIGGDFADYIYDIELVSPLSGDSCRQSTADAVELLEVHRAYWSALREIPLLDSFDLSVLNHVRHSTSFASAERDPIDVLIADIDTVTVRLSDLQHRCAAVEDAVRFVVQNYAGPTYRVEAQDITTGEFVDALERWDWSEGTFAKFRPFQDEYPHPQYYYDVRPGTPDDPIMFDEHGRYRGGVLRGPPQRYVTGDPPVLRPVDVEFRDEADAELLINSFRDSFGSDELFEEDFWAQLNGVTESFFQVLRAPFIFGDVIPIPAARIGPLRPSDHETTFRRVALGQVIHENGRGNTVVSGRHYSVSVGPPCFEYDFWETTFAAAPFALAPYVGVRCEMVERFAVTSRTTLPAGTRYSRLLSELTDAMEEFDLGIALSFAGVDHDGYAAVLLEPAVELAERNAVQIIRDLVRDAVAHAEELASKKRQLDLNRRAIVRPQDTVMRTVASYLEVGGSAPAGTAIGVQEDLGLFRLSVADPPQDALLSLNDPGRPLAIRFQASEDNPCQLLVQAIRNLQAEAGVEPTYGLVAEPCVLRGRLAYDGELGFELELDARPLVADLRDWVVRVAWFNERAVNGWDVGYDPAWVPLRVALHAEQLWNSNYPIQRDEDGLGVRHEVTILGYWN